MYNDLRKLIVLWFGTGIGVVWSILVLINGWGLEPKSYGWIIGGFFVQVFLHWIVKIGASDD